MRILLAGGVFRHSSEDRKLRNPAPEETLAAGLLAVGVDVITTPLEPFVRIALARNFDVIHVHHLSRAALAASLAPLKRPVVFTEHGVPDALPWRLQKARRLIYARSKAIVCLSEREQAIKAANFHVPSDRLWVIPNGIAPPTDRLELKTWSGGPFGLLYVGQLIPLKQVDRVVRALSRLPRAVTLRLAYHNNMLEGDLANLVRDLGLEDRVTFLGPMTPIELREEMTKVQALVLPSAHEALPSVVFEALMNGLPVVASDVGGVCEQIGGAGILISPEKSEDLAPAVLQLMSRYSGYAVAALGRRAEVIEKYSVKTMVDGHIKMYSAIL